MFDATQRSETRDRYKKALMSTPEERAMILKSSPPVRGSTDIHDDPYNHIMQIVFNRWKPYILRAIDFGNGVYYSHFLKQLPITQKVLSQNLKELQKDRLIRRQVLPEVPPRVEYSLTPEGRALVDLLDMIYDWGWVDMRRKGLPINDQWEKWHGYTVPDGEEPPAP